MSNGIRITRPTDFMGNPLATEGFVEHKVKEVIAVNGLAIKPFGFTLDQMQVTTDDSNNKSYSINIPGFVFTLVNDATGVVVGDIDYADDGSSNIVFVNLDATALADAKSFTAFAFVKNDGSKITVLDKQTI